MTRHYLHTLFAPRSVAVFGASPTADSVGGRVYQNLKNGGYAGKLYAINPRHTRIGQDICHSSLKQTNESIDLAVIATPRHTVEGIIRSCGELGVRAAIVISAGFGEQGEEGLRHEKSMIETGRRYGMRILGPNCLGLMHPSLNLNATFSKSIARPGSLALISQSGALCTAIVDWAETRNIGFSSIVSLGAAADIDFGDLLDYLAQDPETQSILLYIEGIRDSRRFLSGLRLAARAKPVIVLKSGRHQEGGRAAMTHTGALVGADDVFDAALQRAGAVRVMTIEQLFSAARLLAAPYRIKGKRLAIISNGGGLGVMATDRAVDLDIKLAELADATRSALDNALPAHWSHANPIDLIGDATPDRYSAAVTACLQDPGVDGILVMLSPQAMTDAEACADTVISAARDKPIMACWMGGKQLSAAKDLFDKHGLPNFDSPESSVEAFSFLTSYYYNQQSLMQVPPPLDELSEPDINGSRLIIDNVLSSQRRLLNITEAKALLRAFSIPVTQSSHCTTATGTLAIAEKLGYPIALKIDSPDISHKSDVGGVVLNIPDAQSLLSAYQHIMNDVRGKLPAADVRGVTIEPMYRPRHGRELIVGVTRDPMFGPVITFGAGGTSVELVRDRSVALPPLNNFLTRKMIAQTRISALLKPYRGIPGINMNALIQVLRRVSEMVCEFPEIIALDINPLIADENGVLALDARIEVARASPALPRYSHMSVQPYPAHLTSSILLADGTRITIRPMRPEDAAIETSFVNRLSAHSRRVRFMHEVKELTPEMLVRLTQLDYDRELAIIAVLRQGDGTETELGVARYTMNPDGSSCEFALVVADDWQGKGIGTRLLKVLSEAARQRGIKEITGEVTAGNIPMLKLVQELGFSTVQSNDDPSVKLVSKAFHA